MSANQLIDLLEEQGLLDPDVIIELRRNVAQSKTRLTTESLAKLLVENGQLTRFQATRLVGQIQEATQSDSESPRVFSNPLSPPIKHPSSTNDELDLLPDDSETAGEKTDPKQPIEAKLIPQDEIIEAIVIVEAEELVEAEEVTAAKASPTKKKRAPTRGADAFGGTGFDTGSVSEEAFVKPVKIAAPKGNAWDSFRIWGVGFFLCVLLAALAWLVYWVLSGSSSQFYAQATEAYEARDYEVAIELFGSFAKKFPKEDKASAAKSFAAIATIRNASDQLGNPGLAIEKAEVILPTIVNEPSMSDAGIRSDLASALVSVAEKLLQQADNAKSTEDRKAFIAKLDKHLEMMRNPQYIPNANRVTNESRIKTIDEERERILRDVQRAEDLVAAIEKMETAIKSADVDGAYQARRTVTRKYPQLELEPKLLALLQEATSLQQQAVKPAATSPSTVDPKSNTLIGRTLLLYKRNGTKVNVAPETILFIKAKGAIYGLRGTDGEVLWRRNADWDAVSEPIRLSNDPASDCLITIPSQNRMLRMSAQDGSSVWELDFGNRILLPLVDGDTIFVATENGAAYAVDATTGQSKWGKQVPQKLGVGLGGSNKSARYLVGDHSNIYGLSRNDGSCVEVFFSGHAPGTIAVPPVYALGQLIVFQNVSAGSALIRLLKADEKTGKLEVAQAAIPLKGHVVVPPSLDGRRLVVMTDLGETIAFDVEPASTGDKLNRIANIVASEIKPKVAWPLVVGNELWIASNRFARFQIQVSKQKLVREWVKEDEDQFTGRPLKMEDFIVHSRTVRGTQGVRVSATKADTGEAVWESDLGVPAIAIQSLASGGISVVNSQAALYTIDATSLAAGKPLNANENPGRNLRSMQFSNPTPLPNGRLAMFNTKIGNNVALLDPSAPAGSNLKVYSLQITSGVPSTEPLALGPSLLIPLDNSQLAYIDPSNGKSLSPQFQPALTAGVNTQWLAPVLLSDQQTIVAATNQRTLHRISSKKQLKELSQTSTPLPWVQRLATVGDVVCGVARGDAQDSLEFYNGPDLSKLDASDVDGRVTWGPYAAGEMFLAYSETSGLAAHDTTGKSKWKTAMPQQALVGPPVVQGDDILINSKAGSMFRITAQSGEIKAVIKIGESLSGAPYVFGNALLFPGSEGTLIAIPSSKTQSSSPEVEAL